MFPYIIETQGRANDPSGQTDCLVMTFLADSDSTARDAVHKDFASYFKRYAASLASLCMRLPSGVFPPSDAVSPWGIKYAFTISDEMHPCVQFIMRKPDEIGFWLRMEPIEGQGTNYEMSRLLDWAKNDPANAALTVERMKNSRDKSKLRKNSLAKTFVAAVTAGQCSELTH